MVENNSVTNATQNMPPRQLQQINGLTYLHEKTTNSLAC